MAIFLRAVGVTLLVALSACVRTPEPSSAAQLEEALTSVTIDNLQNHLAYLASDELAGREPGTQGYDDAAAYVAAEFAALGLEPGGSDGWYQPMDLRSYRVDTSSPVLQIHRGDRTTTLAYRDDFSMGADALRESRSLRAEVIYAGHGVHAPEHGYDDFENLDVDGKILAIFRGAPASIEGSERAYHASSRTKRRVAVERGAVGFITLRTRKEESDRPWAELKDRIGKRWGMTWVSEDGRAPGYFNELLGSASLTMAAAEQLFGLAPLSFEQALEANLDGRVESAPLGVEVSLSVRSEHKSVNSPNVIGMIRGTDPNLANEYIVYSAHLDHIGTLGNHGKQDADTGEPLDALYNGAYDNAMGIALMLETARALAAAPPKRSVLFIALTAEEKGLLGSDFFASNPTVAIESIVANVNLDMPLFLFPVADLVAFGSQHSTLQRVVASAAEQERFFLSPDPLPEENLFVRSDQYSFVRKGVPAVYLIPGFTSTDESVDGEALFRDHLKHHYHEPSDDLSRPVHWDSALRFARANARIGFAIGQEPQRPRWNEGDFFGDTFGR